MTKDSNKELTAEVWNILAKVFGCKPEREDCTFRCCLKYCRCESMVEFILDWHKSECKRFALECVPKYVENIPDFNRWNRCINKMIENIEEKSK